MTALHALGPSIYEFMTLNRCRLYLQVLFLSEICTGDGLYTSGDAWAGNRLDIPRKQSSWPRQQNPSSQGLVYLAKPTSKRHFSPGGFAYRYQ
jgi:hypothetical protein